MSPCCCCCCFVSSVVSDSVRPHRVQPTRLPCTWDSPGKNTRVGCHFLLQCMKVKVKVKSLSHVRHSATPWTAAYQAPPSMLSSHQMLVQWFSFLCTGFLHLSLSHLSPGNVSQPPPSPAHTLGAHTHHMQLVTQPSWPGSPGSTESPPPFLLAPQSAERGTGRSTSGRTSGTRAAPRVAG